MYRKQLTAFYGLMLTGVLMQQPAWATSCRNPASIYDPSVLIKPCSALIASETALVEERVRAFEYRARAYRVAKDFPSAMADVNAALVLKPDDAALYSTRSMIHESQANAPAAWTDAVRAIELDPEQPLYYNRLISFCTNFGLHENARELIEYTDEAFPKDLDLKLVKAFYYRARNDKHQMALTLRNALATSISAERSAVLLTWQRRTMFGDVPIQIFLSEALLGDHQWDEAMQAAERAVAIRRDTTTLTARAWVNATRPGDSETPSWKPMALADVDEALRDDAGFAYAHAVRAHILLYMGRFEDALVSINEAIRLDPQDDIYLWRRFLVNRSLDKIDAAEHDLIRYVGKSDNIAGVVRKLRPHGYWFEAEIPKTITPILLAGLRACARDKSCW